MSQYHRGGVDPHTVALWLFDETLYPNAILTDASGFEHDLRLECAYSRWWRTCGGGGESPEEPLHIEGKYGLVAGKFGNGLYTPHGSPAEVVWPSRSQRYGEHVYLIDRGSEVPERLNLGYLDFTIELWFKAAGPQVAPGVIFGVENEAHRGSAQMANSLSLAPGRSHFMLSSRALTKRQYDFRLKIATDAPCLSDGTWHHLAFTYTCAERQIRHYLDGRLQSIPKKGCFLPTQNRLVSLRISRNVDAVIDEYRISDIVRYRTGFGPPGSFSRNYGQPRPANRPNGLGLLFGRSARSKEPVPILSRKHLFIDAAIIEESDNIAFTVNPPEPVETNFRNTEPWEPSPRFGSTIPDPCTIWKENGIFKMIYTNGGMWGARDHAVCYATSEDGINWDKPVLNLKSWGGNTENNIILRNACQGCVIIDENPNTPPEEKYKYIAWNFYWGMYVFVSPDGIHWRRNEVNALPFDPDGSNATFWDDQCGCYRVYIRASYDRLNRFAPEEDNTYRATARIDVPDLMVPWLFEPQGRPNLDLVMAKPVCGELPIVDTAGQVYRFPAHKYPWAPDTYVAFPWRYLKEGNVRPGSFLMVSRDGEDWKIYEPPYYFPSDWSLNGRPVVEALTEHGMVRQDDEIWQFGTVRFTVHGGVLYGGEEREGGVRDRFMILKQRLDGFVSLDAGDPTGTFVTRPLFAEGNRLELNLASEGSARVAILDASGQPYEGFSMDDCKPISGDGICQEVRWRNGPDLSSLSGKVLRLRFELGKTKLFAMQFAAR